jgi:hypothetical protein
LRTYRSKDEVRINDGGRTDWDPMWAELGRVSFFARSGKK